VNPSAEQSAFRFITGIIAKVGKKVSNAPSKSGFTGSNTAGVYTAKKKDILKNSLIGLIGFIGSICSG
jgi:hypothetical protein